MAEQAKQAFIRRRVTWIAVTLVVGVAFGGIALPLLQGREIHWPIVLIMFMLSVFILVFTLWLAHRLGTYDYAWEQRRQYEGKSLWERTKISILAPPSNRPYFRLFFVFGGMILVGGLGTTILAFVAMHPWQIVSGVGSALFGGATIAYGIAEFLPTARRRTAAIIRVSYMLLSLVSAILIWVALLNMPATTR